MITMMMMTMAMTQKREIIIMLCLTKFLVVTIVERPP